MKYDCLNIRYSRVDVLKLSSLLIRSFDNPIGYDRNS